MSAASFATPAHADPGAVPDPIQPAPEPAVACPAPVAAADIVAGTVGTGWTVNTGDTPQPFKVEVLGVLKDGIGAGRDMVMIKISDLDGSTVVGDNGIWSGMSGSPVYVGGKLLGAISYGFTYSPSPIGGLTPASDMMNVLSAKSVAAKSMRAESEGRTKVALSAGQRKTLEARASAAVPRTLERLRTPLSVSGLSSKRLSSLQGAFDRAGKSVVAYAGSRASAVTQAAAAPPVAGGNFAAVISYGDLTIGGVGTTTAVCGTKVLAFGHPMDFAGKVSYGANAATSLAIIKDDSSGSFKMANIGGTVGTVDQDRLAAIRATLGKGPATTAITSTITNLDNGKKRTGITQVAAPDYTALATVYGLWANYDSTFDKWGKGIATSSWTIKGTRAGGKALVVSRSNMFADLGDPTVEPAFEVADAVDSILTNEYEPVKINSITFKSSAKSSYNTYRMTKLAVSVNGGKYKTDSVIKVKPKAKLKVRVTVRGYQSTVDRNVYLNLTVAKRYAKQTGRLTVQGGLSAGGGDLEDDTSCLLSDCDESGGSLNSIIAGIKAPPANNAVRADLDFGENADGQFSTDAKYAAKAPVAGEKSIVIKVKKK